MTPKTAPRADFRARYFVESAVPSEKVAEVIAGEQSSGTFLSLPLETGQLKERKQRTSRPLRLAFYADDFSAMPA
jgi:ribulose-bisphosphate carboxylase large chain